MGKPSIGATFDSALMQIYKIKNKSLFYLNNFSIYSVFHSYFTGFPTVYWLVSINFWWVHRVLEWQ